MIRLQFAASVCLILASPAGAGAQTPFSTSTVAKASTEGDVTAAAASAANSWLGAQLGYKFGQNSDELGDNLLVSASVIYEIPLESGRKFHLPVVSNFAHLVASPAGENKDAVDEDKLKELLFATSGVRAGVYPYGEVTRLSKTDFKFIIHGEASWKLNGFKNDETEDVSYLNQLRLAGGVEIAIGKTDQGSKPLTLSVTPVHTRFDPKEYEKAFTTRKSSLTSLEVVAVVPVSARTGVLFEYVGGEVSSFRAGLIVATEK